MNLSFMDAGILVKKALDGHRLFPEEAIYLCAEGSLPDLARAAREIARRYHPADTAGYAVTATIVYSNVCQPNCPFCAGTVSRDDPAAFTRTPEQVADEAAAAFAAGATQITLQGGHRIDLPWDYYPGLLRAIKDRVPDVQILAYSPSEVMVMNVAYQKRTSSVIAELKAAGMGGLLAGGAERLPTRAPEYRALLRGPWNEWFDVVHRAADADLPIVAPFVFGLGESAKERVGHLYRVRAVQERTVMAGRPALVALAVFTLPPAAGEQPVSGEEYQRMLALARLVVPSIPHVVASGAGQGFQVALAALDGGADDLGGTDLTIGAEALERLIVAAGRTPRRRSGWYTHLPH